MKTCKSHIKLLLASLLFVSISELAIAQYAPPVGHLGTTAIHTDSSVFVDWAVGCTLQRGYADISDTEIGLVTYGEDLNGIGKADNVVVSLGDGGIAILNFRIPISDGDGWDFAVFENSFLDDFLELAFVEVSSNGVDYYRFNSVSITQQDTQVSTFGLVNTTKIHNLAGKYQALYGTPFDLKELKDIPGLDIHNIISIRIIDVVGSINDDFASYDTQGNIINEPWPTPFESGGFDIDAVGVINNQDNTLVSEIGNNLICTIFPNPTSNYLNITAKERIDEVLLFDIKGTLIIEFTALINNKVNIESLPCGIYIVKIFTDNSLYINKIIKR